MNIFNNDMPFLLHFLEPVASMPAPAHQYDPVAQCEVADSLFAGTQRTRSYQNSTSGYGPVTGYEDYDDEYITTSD